MIIVDDGIANALNRAISRLGKELRLMHRRGEDWSSVLRGVLLGFVFFSLFSTCLYNTSFISDKDVEPNVCFRCLLHFLLVFRPCVCSPRFVTEG
jgi:hypothetical protein